MARKTANLYNLSYTGTLGGLVNAKENGLLPCVGNAIESLIRHGMWLSDSIIDEALRTAGERRGAWFDTFFTNSYNYRFLTGLMGLVGVWATRKSDR